MNNNTSPKLISRELKNSTIAIDFDGVLHRYSKGFQGLYNAYDIPTAGTRDALETFKKQGYRLIVVSSRPVQPIIEWLKKYELFHFFDKVTNIKEPAKFYIDDHGVRFPREMTNAWDVVLDFINKNYEENDDGK